MRIVRTMLTRLAATLRGHERADADLRLEMEAHLALAIDENLRRGMPPDEARRQALLDSGGLTQAATLVRAQRGLPWLETLAADASYAVRHFRRVPLATATMILVLSLGLGTNVVLLTVLNSLATLPPPGIAPSEALVRIRGSTHPTSDGGAQARLLSWPEVRANAGRTELFGGVAAHATEAALVDVGDATRAPASARVMFATPNYFALLGVRPTLGTEPAADPDVTRLATSPTAVISDAMWRRQFGGTPDVIGRVVRVNDVPVRIVGVAPPRFIGTDGGSAMAMWMPLAAYPVVQRRSAAVFVDPDSLFLAAFARLRPGYTASAATPIVASIAERATASGASGATTGAARRSTATATADVVPLRAANSRVSQRADQLLSVAASGGVALLVLLVTCTNVSALLVGLAVARRREVGVRLALGASRWRLVRQLLTESVLLSTVASAVGLAVTAVGIRAVGALLEDVQLTVDWRVTAATCAVAIVTGILFGLSPALHATRISMAEALKSSSLSVAATRGRLQRALVVAQIALTQPLLVAFGLVVATMVTDVRGRPTAGVSARIAEIELDAWSGRVSPEVLAARIATIVDRVAAMPGVVAAMPMQMGTVTVPLAVHPEDRVAGTTSGAVLEARLTAAPAGYFDAFGMRVVRGRAFTAGDYARASHDPTQLASYDAVVVGVDLARRLWGAADPLGRRFVLALGSGSRSAPLTVVGVMDGTIADPRDGGDRVRVYVPYATMNTGVIARTAGPAAPMLDALRRTVAAVAPQLPVHRAQTMEQREAEQRRDLLRATGAAAGGGLLLLLLSALGLYAVVSFSVAQRTPEIGIRTALGASSGRVVRMFFVRGLALSALGLVVGWPLGMAVQRVVVGTLALPLATSPLLGVAIGAVVLVVASVAVWVPARRASAIAPVIALRTE